MLVHTFAKNSHAFAKPSNVKRIKQNFKVTTTTKRYNDMHDKHGRGELTRSRMTISFVLLDGLV